MRAWSVSAFFPEVKPAHEAQQSCTVQGSSIAVAANRGLTWLMERDALKGKQISTVRLTIVAAGKEKPSS